MEGLLDSLRSLANSTDASGRSIFGGFRIGDPPFEVNSANETIFVGDRGVHKVKISNQMELQTSVDGASVFERVSKKDGSVASVFTLVEEMISNLGSGNVNSLPIDDLKNAASHLADQRAFIGAQMNKADSQRAVLENRMLVLSTNIGELEDADLGKIITDLQGLLVNKEAAQKAFARISQLNLFDMIA